MTLARQGWGQDNPTFRQLFTGRFIPAATKEQTDSYNELQRKTATPENAARYIETWGDIDVRELLPKVTTPTLVMHVRDDAMAPLSQGRELASRIPGARFVVMEGKNHLFLEGEVASERFFEEIELFLKG